MRLIDVDALKDACNMADDCKSCPREWRKCGNIIEFSRMDFCTFLDDAPTYDAPEWVPIEEQLPGPFDVLAYSERHKDMLYGHIEKINGRWVCVCNGDETLPDISHWMVGIHPPQKMNGGAE